MRKAMTMLGVLALGAAVSARAEEKKGDRSSNVARAMAVAQIDFDLHRAQLGLVGSSLPSEIQASAVARAMAVAELDFDLHRASLGLSGSSLLSERYARADSARPPAGNPVADLSAIPADAPTVPAGISEPRQ